MKLLITTVYLITLFSISHKSTPDCDDAVDYGDNAYTYFKKAYQATSLDDAKYYAKKGMREAEDAEDAASDSDCECEEAESSAVDAYSYGKKAYNLEKLSDAHYYAKKARDAAEYIVDEAEECME